MDVFIKKWKDGTISNDEFENEWYRMIHSKPHKKSDKRTFQVSWSTHPISKDLVTLRNAAPSYKKKAITACIKYGKAWWGKTTDTYLFPAYAISIFLSRVPDTDKPVLLKLGKEQAMDVYRLMETHAGPDDFVRKIVVSDQHTAMGVMNGVGKKGPYAIPTFSLYHSAVRPYTKGCEWVYRDYIEYRLGHMEPRWKQQAYDNLKAFGEGKTTHSQFWDETCLIMKHGLGLMEPTPPSYWKEIKEPIRKNPEVKHPNPDAAFHYRCSPLRDGWGGDMLTSGLQKMIRRSCLFDACWCACRLLMFALFHQETRMGDTVLWSIYPKAQAKITNMINRLIVITTEDFYPDPKLFIDITQVLELGRKKLMELKEPQQETLYHKRFEMMVNDILAVVISLISRPKQHYIGSRLFKFREHYNRAEASLMSKEIEETKKRKQADIRTLFNF